MNDNIWGVVDMMHIYGGDFVKSLAVAWKRADGLNKQLLHDTFEKYFDEYEEIFNKVTKKRRESGINN